jgi:Ala-tRNA(Pro) deacylase
MKVTEFLDQCHVDYELLEHRDAYTAQRMAQILHVPGREVAKTVLLRDGGQRDYILAVLPATKRVDFRRLGQALGGAKVELASEPEMNQLCPDCEPGALPPFGSGYGMRTLVDESLCEDETIVFEGNTHHEAIRMKFRDYRRLESPTVASFAR